MHLEPYRRERGVDAYLCIDSSAAIKKKGVPSAVGFLHCAGSGEGLFLSPKPYPHKSAAINDKKILSTH